MITCQYCGTKNPTGASFCDGCGAALTATVASQAQATAQAHLAAAHAARAQATAQRGAVHAASHFGTGRLPPQTMLNKRYLILNAIGRGGMAAVYQASDTRSNRIVAIKEMSQDGLSPDEVREAQESFRREAGLLQTLSHPNLPKVHESFSEQGRNYLVMDYIDGETLEQKLLAAKRPLREAEVLYWARQLCDALGYLHSRRPPIIFRDLKPANVMVTKRGEVKLIDFGIARLFSRGATHDTQALGTPGYAPPEQYGNAQTDARADIYALGATLYHLLTNYDVGTTPFALPPLRSRNPAVSARTADAIEHATRLDRKDRYSEIGQFARDLGVNTPPKSASSAQAGNGARAQARPTAKPRAATNGSRPAGTASPAASAISAQLATVSRAVAVGTAAAGAQLLKARLNPQAPAPSAGDLAHTFIAAARTATGPSVAPQVQPRQLDLGRLFAGQDGAATLTVSGQNGASIQGSIKSLSPWLHVDITQFSGASSLIQVTARTNLIRGVGVQQGAVEVSVGNQRMYIPVRLEVVAAPRAQPAPKPAPKPQPVPQPRAQARAQAAAASALPGMPPFIASARKGAQIAAQQAAQQSAQQQTFAYRAPRRPRSLEGLRWPLALVIALIFAFGLPLLLANVVFPQVGSPISDPMWLARALLGVGIVGAMVGAPLAYIGDIRAPGRLRTTALLTGAGSVAAVALTAAWQLTPAWSHMLPAASQVGALALTAPVFAALGAALGAQPMVSAGVLSVARYIAARYRLVLLTAAIAGGWFGFAASQSALSTVFQQAPWALSLIGGCGLVVGVALGLTLATPVGYLVRRFAFG